MARCGMRRALLTACTALLAACGATPPAAPAPDPGAVARETALRTVLPQGSVTGARQAVQAGNLRVAIVGESIAEGGNAAPGLAWGDLLAAELRTQVPGVELSNRALGNRWSVQYLRPSFQGLPAEPENTDQGYGPRTAGDRPWVSAGQSWRDAVQATRPDVLIIALGVNEIWTDTTPEAAGERWRSNLTAMITDARTWTPRPDVIVMTSLPFSSYTPAGLTVPYANLAAVTRVSREVAATQGAALADVARAWEVYAGRPDPVTGVQVPGVASEAQLYGSWPGDLTVGGNGFNHPSHWAHRELYLGSLRAWLAALR